MRVLAFWQQSPSAAIEQLGSWSRAEGGDTAEEWVWEAMAGPGPKDPFREDWVGGDWDSD